MGPTRTFWLWVFAFLLIVVVIGGALESRPVAAADAAMGEPLTFTEAAHDVTLGNGRLKITLGKGGVSGLRGSVRSLVYKSANGTDVQLLQSPDFGDRSKEKFPGYWDMHWDERRSGIAYHNSKCRFGQASRAILTEAVSDEGLHDDMLGVTYQQEMKAQKFRGATSPLNTMVHYAVRKDVTGIYCTLKLDHSRSHPAMSLAELRLVLKLNPELFDYSYVADDRQRFMHTRKDISRQFSSRLAFKEARLLTRPENVSHSGEVDHKYTHSVETKDATLYGWISTKLGIGVWLIAPNKWEYLGGGPTKQELSVQTGPKLLAMLHSHHYGTPFIDLDDGEAWAKLFGPFLIYVNEGPSTDALVADAKSRAAKEVQSWPYQWVPFADYVSREERGLVVGRLVVDQPTSMLNPQAKQALAGMWVGLTDESASTSNWELEVKHYQYWNCTTVDGEFTIYNVRPGRYVLQTFVHGLLVDTSDLHVVTVRANWVSDVGDVVMRPLQQGPILWEIGYPDRSATEFMVAPEAKVLRPTFIDSNSTMNSNHKDAFRQYGLWQKYLDLYPERDPVYKIGESHWGTDWYFAHVLRPEKVSNQREISFVLPLVWEGEYMLRIAIAGAHQAALEIRMNDPLATPLFDTGPFGKDNALARAGLHGNYYEFSIPLSHFCFRIGQNSIFIRQRRAESRFNYVMYDYLRLEAPPVV